MVVFLSSVNCLIDSVYSLLYLLEIPAVSYSALQ